MTDGETGERERERDREGKERDITGTGEGNPRKAFLVWSLFVD